jgi:hypothetical protein
MELGTAVGIKEVIAWWGDGYEALRFIDSEEDILRDKLIKVPNIAPKVFPLERGSFAPIFAACTQINDPNISSWDGFALPCSLSMTIRHSAREAYSWVMYPSVMASTVPSPQLI